jgi:hypothetical protein
MEDSFPITKYGYGYGSLLDGRMLGRLPATFQCLGSRHAAVPLFDIALSTEFWSSLYQMHLQAATKHRFSQYSTASLESETSTNLLVQNSRARPRELLTK